MPLVANTQTRGTTDWGTRTRGYITADARNQTEYGTVRSYIAVGLSAGGAGTAADVAAGSGPGFSANRAFVQFAGFTFGLSQSFFDLYSGTGDVVLRRRSQPVGRQRRRRQGCDGLYRAVRQRLLGLALGSKVDAISA